jgi:two-component system sensor histidine kinase PilS (NtrC family)
VTVLIEGIHSEQEVLDTDNGRRALRVFHLYRMVVAALLLVLYVADRESTLLDTLDNPLFFLQINQVYAILVLIGYAVTYVDRLSLTLQAHAAIFIDVIVLTLIVQTTGGLASGLNVLLVPSIAAGGLLLPGRLALAYAAMAFFASVASLINDGTPLEGIELTRAGVLGSIFVIGALVMNFLAERARKSEELADQRERELAELARLNELIVQRMQTGLVAIGSEGEIKLMNQSAQDALGCGRVLMGQPLRTLSAPLAKHLNEWEASPNQPGGPAEQPEAMPGLLVAYMRVGEARHTDTVIFLERQSDAEARLQQVKLAAVGRLTAGIAHEIRNPLAAVSNAAQLLQESAALEPGEKRVAEIIRNNARRMNRIVENILQVSRRERARPRLLLLGPFLQSLSEEFHSTRPESFASLTVEVEPDDLQVYFDPGHLHQVVWNLCQNACRHGVFEGELAEIVVRAYRVTAGSSRVLLDVLDSGPGVPEDHVSQLFEPFYTTSTKGTGLGLYLSKELSEFNRASLIYRDRPGRGACFRITFSSKESRDQQWPIELH